MPFASSDPAPPMAAIRSGLFVASESRIKTELDIAAVKVTENRKPIIKAEGIKYEVEKKLTRISDIKETWIYTATKIENAIISMSRRILFL